MNTKKLLLLMLMAPAVIAHELTYAVAPLPWATDWQFNRSNPSVTIEYIEGTPITAVQFANLAPTMIVSPSLRSTRKRKRSRSSPATASASYCNTAMTVPCSPWYSSRSGSTVRLPTNFLDEPHSPSYFRENPLIDRQAYSYDRIS